MRAKPKLMAFFHAGSSDMLTCPLCGYRGHGRYWADRHAKDWHYLCICGRWVRQIQMHLAACRRRSKAHG